MAVIGVRNFATKGPTRDMAVELIDTPDKLLIFAKQNSIKLVPLDLENLCAKLGVEIKEVSFSSNPDLSGKIYKDNEERWIIEVNKNHHKNRKRYTIAHEIAHFCLHKTNFEDEIFFRGGSEISQEEWQANDFAGKILIPETDLIEKVSSGVTNIEELARIYAVSSLALRIRAKNLGMSGHGL